MDKDTLMTCALWKQLGRKTSRSGFPTTKDDDEAVGEEGGAISYAKVNTKTWVKSLD